MSSIDNQINQMVSASAGTASPSPAFHGVANPHPTMIADTGDGTVKIVGGLAGQSASTAPTRLEDRGQDVDVAVNQINTGLQKMQADLNAVKYDQDTGQPLYVLQGRARELLQLQFEQARKSAVYDLSRLQSLADQRTADAAASAAAQHEELRVAQFVGGDPARAAALKQALIDREAGAFAEQLLAGRVNK